MEDDSLCCSVSELMATFRLALMALIPAAERLKMNWRDEHQHRDWERMAVAVFDACVRGPIASDSSHWNDELSLPRYDIDHTSYLACSWIRVEREAGPSAVLIRLLSHREPFDTVQVVTLNPDTFAPVGRLTLPFGESEFAFVRRSGTRPDEVVHEIEAIE
jgi:hypothetical protein